MLRLVNKNIFHPPKCQSRSLWEWVNMMFNQPDQQRIKEVGPDRACAEWLLRNGGAVRWTGERQITNDYNKLPVSTHGKAIEEIDASDSSISHYGFGHLTGCKHITRIILHKCSYLTDEAIKGLSYVDSPLKYLQISSCRNITDDGLKSLPALKHLEKLLLYDLPAIKNMPECEKHLKNILPDCNIETADKATDT